MIRPEPMAQERRELVVLSNESGVDGFETAATGFNEFSVGRHVYYLRCWISKRHVTHISSARRTGQESVCIELFAICMIRLGTGIHDYRSIGAVWQRMRRRKRYRVFC